MLAGYAVPPVLEARLGALARHLVQSRLPACSGVLVGQVGHVGRPQCALVLCLGWQVLCRCHQFWGLLDDDPPCAGRCPQLGLWYRGGSSGPGTGSVMVHHCCLGDFVGLDRTKIWTSAPLMLLA